MHRRGGCQLVTRVHAQEFHKKGDYLGPRKWSPRALWKFREFNELPHIFERRYAASAQTFACTLCACSPPPTSRALTRGGVIEWYMLWRGYS